jgi:Zn-dependent peptidase ImmA (M78 family)
MCGWSGSSANAVSRAARRPMAGPRNRRSIPAAEDEAVALREELSVRRAPVPVEAIAGRLGAAISYEPFDGNVSGMLYRNGGQVIIGVNARQAQTRQRFSIAHELGHLRMHPGDKVFIDQTVCINVRDQVSSQVTDREEIEANAFADELLMPAGWVRREVDRLGGGPWPGEDALIADLARRFGVSRQAMEHRLMHLGIRRELWATASACFRSAPWAAVVTDWSRTTRDRASLDDPDRTDPSACGPVRRIWPSPPGMAQDRTGESSNLAAVSQRAGSATAPAWSNLGVSHDRARASALGL